ncbi:MAG: OmpA family protein [bacterium]|nr:OmpA family protein [bacterium]
MNHVHPGAGPRICLALAALVCLASPAPAGEGELGIVAGFFMPDPDISGKQQRLGEIEPLAGLRGGYIFADHWGWSIDATFSDINSATAASDIDARALRTGIDWYLTSTKKKQQFYFSFGGGRADYEFETPAPPDGDGIDRDFVSLGFGQRFKLDHRARVRWELRADRTLSDEGLDGADLTRAQLLLSISWGIGVDPEVEEGCTIDTDGDGVCDDLDECPDTPRGAIVDPRGCPLDSDGDGVYDGIDECPDTPRGAIVGPRGCPLDSDGDGVYDGIDECPDTPRGAIVDPRGCPLDSDGDGVYDGIDECPDTPRGAIVDPRGCPLDSDGDGVYDGIDECPGTPPGVPVNARGCPRAAPLFVEEKRTLVLDGVLFDFNSADLTADSRMILDRVTQSLVDWPEVQIEIGGHTDAIGPDAYNLDLSKRRAAAVSDHLARGGVDPGRLAVRGYGETQPVADNSTKEGRDQNRRVELSRTD